ncbi:MAG: hypothetical protein AB1746_07860 [Candidatus Zixiibacteriota bacterium]
MRTIKKTTIILVLMTIAIFAGPVEGAYIPQKPHSINASYGYGNLMEMTYSSATHAFSLGYIYQLNKHHFFGITTGMNIYNHGSMAIPAVAGAWGETDYRMYMFAPYMGLSEDFSKIITSEISFGPGYYVLRRNVKTGNYITGVSDEETTNYDAIGAYFGIRLDARLSPGFGAGLVLNGYFPFFDLISDGSIAAPDVSDDFKDLVPMFYLSFYL